TGARVLHLDHVGAEIGEERTAPGAGDDAREIDHTDAVEREGEGGHGAYYTAAARARPALRRPFRAGRCRSRYRAASRTRDPRSDPGGRPARSSAAAGR